MNRDDFMQIPTEKNWRKKTKNILLDIEQYAEKHDIEGEITEIETPDLDYSMQGIFLKDIKSQLCHDTITCIGIDRNEYMPRYNRDNCENEWTSAEYNNVYFELETIKKAWLEILERRGEKEEFFAGEIEEDFWKGKNERL